MNVAYYIAALLLYACVMGNALLEAYREVCIEGPVGWSADTWTKRYSPNSWIGKKSMQIMGDDKAPTQYHLVSSGLWLLMYLPALPLVLVYGGMHDGSIVMALLINVFTVIVASWLLTINAEDYIWFIIHPYYGPGRYSANYIPWIQHYTLGIQTTYIPSTVVPALLVVFGAWATGQWPIIILWLLVLAGVVLTCFVITQSQKGRPRKFLAKHWWENPSKANNYSTIGKYILKVRCPYPEVEPGEVNLTAQVYVMTEQTFESLLAEGKIWGV